MKTRMGDMTIDQIIEFCNKRLTEDGPGCDRCPFNRYDLCMWNGFEDIVNKEIDVDDVGLAPIDIYNKFREEFPEMLEGMICWEYNRDLIENKQIVIRIRKDPLTEERWIYDYEDNDMRRAK